MPSQNSKLDEDFLVTDPEDLLALCQSLVVLDRSFDPPVVALPHSSVKEYLLSERIAGSSAQFFHLNVELVHRYVADACIHYLSFTDFACTAPKAAPATLATLREMWCASHVLDYTAEFWHEHLRPSGVSSEDFGRHVQQKLRWFLELGVDGTQYTNWLSVWHLVCMGCVEYNGCHEGCSYQPSIYHTILFGLEHAFDMLLPHFHTLNDQFRGGWTPLTAALSIRLQGIAFKLLGAGADPSVAASSKIKSLIPLHIAAEYALEEFFEELLRAGVDPHARTTTPTTPFYRAARGGSIPIMKILHERNCDVNARTWDNWTAIYEAILINRIDILQQLLDWGAEIDLVNRQDLTPLDIAIVTSRDEIARMLAEFSTARSQSQTIVTTPITPAAYEETASSSTDKQKGSHIPSKNDDGTPTSAVCLSSTKGAPPAPATWYWHCVSALSVIILV